MPEFVGRAGGTVLELFDTAGESPWLEPIADGLVVLRRHALEPAQALLSAIDRVTAEAPLVHRMTPGGHPMSVAMTCCGEFGWVTDRQGYRYQRTSPETDFPWPPMPAVFRQLAQNAAVEAGYPGFDPDACLINRYARGAKMGLHQDRDEQDFRWPIVSVSLGLPINFQFGGRQRNERPRKILLEHGDVVVWGGESRLNYHGVLTLKAGEHPLTGPYRYNLTFRRAR